MTKPVAFFQTQSSFLLLKNLLLLLLLLFLFSVVQAQERQANEWGVYLKPLSLIDPLTGTIQPGITKRINNHFAVSFDYGIKFPLLSYYYKTSERKNYHYSKSSLEIKYIFKKGIGRKNADGYFYIGLRSLYFPQHYRVYNDYFLQDGEAFQYDYSDLKRTAWTSDFILGLHAFKGRVSFTPYFGVGLRVITIKQQPNHLVSAFIEDPIDWNFSSHIERRNGTTYRPDFPEGFTLGYRFGK